MYIQKLFFTTAIFMFVCIYAFCQKQTGNNSNYVPQKKIICNNGAVVSAHWLASKAGVAILKKGGNAIDAAIATQLVLAVVYPAAGNIGGGGFMVAHFTNGKNISLDFREKAPEKASRNMYLDSAGNAQINASQDGHLAAGVPGTIAGLFASMKYAKLPFAVLIESAINLAENGFAISASQARSFNRTKKEFIELNFSTIAFVKENEWKAGDVLIQKDLANTLKRIRDNGQKGFYEGETAKLIVAEMQKGKGIISLEDLKKYEAKERSVVDFTYKGYQIITMPLPSSGGVILQQMMKMIEDKNIALMQFQSAASVQLMVELERMAYADRAEFLGDPDFVNVPINTLVSTNYLNARMKDYVPGKAGSSKNTMAGIIKESEETTHLSVTDMDGNAVSVTTTLNGGYGSRTVVGGAGFLLNNEMDDFSIKQGVPNMYGALGNEKNAIAPGKRMLSSMTPTLVLKNGFPYLVLGTPGGTTIPTSIFQTLVNILEFNMSAEEAVNKPKFHHQWLPDIVSVEKDFAKKIVKQLENMGYKIVIRDAWSKTDLIQIQNHAKGSKTIIAVGDKRGDDDAQGY